MDVEGKELPTWTRCRIKSRFGLVVVFNSSVPGGAQKMTDALLHRAEARARARCGSFAPPLLEKEKFCGQGGRLSPCQLPGGAPAAVRVAIARALALRPDILFRRADSAADPERPARCSRSSVISRRKCTGGHRQRTRWFLVRAVSCDLHGRRCHRRAGHPEQALAQERTRRFLQLSDPEISEPSFCKAGCGNNGTSLFYPAHKISGLGILKTNYNKGKWWRGDQTDRRTDAAATSAARGELFTTSARKQVITVIIIIFDELEEIPSSAKAILGEGRSLYAEARAFPALRRGDAA